MTDAPDSAAASAEPAPPPAGGRRLLPWIALILLAGVAAYANFFPNAFQFDDTSAIVRNGWIRELRRWPAYFTDAETLTANPRNASWRPAATLEFALAYRIGGLDPRVFHALQLAWHLATALALFVLARALLRLVRPDHAPEPLAALAAVVHAVHPLHSQSLNIMTLVSEVMASFGALACLALFVARPRLRPTLLWLAPLAAGALAKQTALAAPLLLGALLLLFPELRDRGRGLRGWRGQLAAALLVAAALFLLQAVLNGPRVEFGRWSRWVYFRSEWFVWLHYLRQFLLPAGLTVDYNWPAPRHLYDSEVMAGLVGGLALAGLAWRHWRAAPARRRLLPLGLLWYLFALAPSSSLQPLPDLVSENRAYLPGAGLALALLAFAPDLADRLRRLGPRAPAAAAALLVMLLGGLTLRRNRDYRTPRSLWESALDVNRDSVRGWSFVAQEFLLRGNLDGAEACLKECLRRAPRNSECLSTQARLEVARGHPADAIARLAEFTRDHPELPDPHAAYAEAAHAAGDAALEERELRATLALAPGHARARAALLMLLGGAGRWPEYCAEARRRPPLVAPPEIQETVRARCENGGGP